MDKAQNTKSVFAGIEQVPVDLGGRAVPVPAFYRDASGMTAVFPARRSRLAQLLGDCGLAPASLLPGVGLIGASCFEYRDSDAGRYNEMVVSVIVNDPSDPSGLPSQAVVRALRRNRFHAHVLHLPVTSEPARALGYELCGLPKTIAELKPQFGPDGVRCDWIDAGEPVLALAARRLPRGRPRQLQIFSHQPTDGAILTTEFRLRAHPLAKRTALGTARLELGPRHPIAREIDALLLSRRALHCQQMEGFEGVLYDAKHPAAG